MVPMVSRLACVSAAESCFCLQFILILWKHLHVHTPIEGNITRKFAFCAFLERLCLC